MKMKSKCLLLLIFALSALIIGCSSEGSSEQSASDNGSDANGSASVQLTLAHGWTGEVPMAEAFEPGVEKFIGENEHIDLTVETAPGNAIRDKIVTDMAANNAPDVFLHWGIRDTERYIANDKLADLTEMINDDPDMAELYIDNAYAASTFQGKIYGLPIEAYNIPFVVNTDMFAEHDVKIPETIDELKEAVQFFEGEGFIPIAANDVSIRYVIMSLSDQLHAGNAEEHLLGRTPFGDELLEAVQLVEELQEMKAFPEGKETMETLQALELFNSGNSPMYFQHSWTMGEVDESLSDSVEVIPFPSATQDGLGYMTTGVGYFVYMSQDAFDDENKREAAWELMKYLAGPDVAKDLVELASNPSPVQTDYDFSKVPPAVASALELQQSVDVTTPMYQDLLSLDAARDFEELVVQLGLGEIAAEEFVNRLNETISEHPNNAYE